MRVLGEQRKGVHDVRRRMSSAQYALAPERGLPPVPADVDIDVWEVESTEDAVALLAGCPQESVICCAFTAPHADGVAAQKAALQELAAAQPAGFVFATVDIHACPEVKTWASITSPATLIMQPDGIRLDEIKAAEPGAPAVLQLKVLGIASVVAKAAQSKLEVLAERFPGATCAEASVTLPKADTTKMRAHGLEGLQRAGVGAEKEASFETLCQSLAPDARAPRVRDLAALSRIVRDVPSAELVPLLDLARRLVALKAVSSGDQPGMREAVGFLVDAALCRGIDEAPELTRASLALHLIANLLAHDSLQEALLPVIGQIVRGGCWAEIWRSTGMDAPPAPTVRAREAAAALLLNASVALRTSRCRAEHSGLLVAALDALHRDSNHERLNQAAGTLLSVGGQPEDAKRVLQAQPRAPLRLLAASIFRGEMEKPEERPFPLAWAPEAPPRTAGGPTPDANARNPRGAGGRGRIPNRHRGRGGG